MFFEEEVISGVIEEEVISGVISFLKRRKK